MASVCVNARLTMSLKIFDCSTSLYVNDKVQFDIHDNDVIVSQCNTCVLLSFCIFSYPMELMYQKMPDWQFLKLQVYLCCMPHHGTVYLRTGFFSEITLKGSLVVTFHLKIE